MINLISKVPGYPDGDVVEPDALYQPGFKHYANGPRLHEYLKAMNREVLSKYDAMTVGEMPFIRDHGEILKAVGAQEEELNMIFIFELVDIDNKVCDRIESEAHRKQTNDSITSLAHTVLRSTTGTLETSNHALTAGNAL